jgi:ribosomal protein S18 acetylase RimI-like enzyme
MPAIEIRPVSANDLTALAHLTHEVETRHTWQLITELDEGQMQVEFNRIRLPRPFNLEYPRNPEALVERWKKRDLFLVARIGKNICGYLCLDKTENQYGRVVDLVIGESFRRQGVATALLVAAQDWMRVNGIFRMILEIPVKNEATLALAEKLGFVLCGFMDGFFESREIAFFYSMTLR